MQIVPSSGSSVLNREQSIVIFAFVEGRYVLLFSVGMSTENNLANRKRIASIP